MSKILYINPLGLDIWDEHFEEILNSAAEPSTQVDAIHLSIEERTPFVPTLPFYLGDLFRAVKRAEEQRYDAVIIGCALDPGLKEAKAMVSIPVVGPSEACMHTAAMLSQRFSVIVTATDPAFLYLAQDNARRYGLDSKIASYEVANIKQTPPEVIDTLMEDSQKLRDVILGNFRKAVKEGAGRKAKKAVKEDGAGALVFCCTLFSGMLKPLAEELKVPIIDPAVGSLKVAEMLVGSVCYYR